MSEIDNLLDSTLDDLEDLPEFKNFPAGSHRCLASLELKEINDKQAVELKLVGQETMELATATDAPLKEGDSCSTVFFLDNEFGRGALKAVLADFAEFAGSRNNREIIEAVKDVECVALTSENKKGYLVVKQILVV